jgi:hypothetical protein
VDTEVTHGPETAQDAPAEVTHPVVAVPVHVGHDVNIQGQAADFGAYQTYVLPAGADQARPILPMDPNRHRATITVSAPGVAVAGSGAWIGTQAQCQASPPVGGFLPVGVNAYPVEHNQAVWLIGDGTNAMRVTVAVERWDSAGN